ncbi:hypothetical protein RQP46_003357 [Phenoliferia psychrophenolica]
MSVSRMVILCANLSCPPDGVLTWPDLPPGSPTPPKTPNDFIKATPEVIGELCAAIFPHYTNDWEEWPARHYLLTYLGAPISVDDGGKFYCVSREKTGMEERGTQTTRSG